MIESLSSFDLVAYDSNSRQRSRSGLKHGKTRRVNVKALRLGAVIETSGEKQIPQLRGKRAICLTGRQLSSMNISCSAAKYSDPNADPLTQERSRRKTDCNPSALS